jgi:hypothetical protein
MPSRRDEIAVAIAAYDQAADEPLPRNAARLLAVMFPVEDVCHRSLEALVSEGFNRNTLPAMLRRLEAVGLLSRQRGSAAIPDTYRLRLPALVRL